MGDGLKRVAALCGGLVVRSGDQEARYGPAGERLDLGLKPGDLDELAEWTKRACNYLWDGRTKPGKAERRLLAAGYLTESGRGVHGKLYDITEAGREAFEASRRQASTDQESPTPGDPR